jgi:hypothetical protein
MCTGENDMKTRHTGLRRTGLGMTMCFSAGIVLAGGAFAQETPAPAPPPAPPAQQADASPAVAPTSDGYGLSKAEAIEVCDPVGQRQYLARLLCPDSRHPEFARTGNVGPRQDIPEGASEEMLDAMMADMFKPRKLEPGEPDHHIVDAYEVACGEQVTVLYLDMYHCAQDRPDRAPAGFTIID